MPARLLRRLRARLRRLSPLSSTKQREWYALAQAEQLAGVGSWEVDAASGEARCSPNLRLMLGLGSPEGEFAEAELWKLVHADDWERLKGIIEAGRKAGQAYEDQARFRLGDGSERVFLVRGRAVADARDGRVIKYIGAIQDVTNRAGAEAALKESEGRYRDLVEHSRSLMCLHDLDGRLLWMNELPARLLGYSRQNLIGRRIPDMLEREIREQFDQYMERIRRDGHAEGLLRVVARSGERRIWEYQNTLQTGAFSTPLVRGMAHDITELKRTEKSLQTFRTLIDLSNDGFGVIDAETLRIIDANNNLCSRLGYTREELLQLSIGEIDPTFEIGEEGRGPGGLTRESEYRRKDGSRFPVELNVSFVRLGKAYFVAVVRDITERKGRERIMQQQEEQLRRLTAHLIASHDRERRRVASALNEGAAQELFGVALDLGELRGVRDRGAVLGIVDQSQETLSRAITQIRGVSNRLHPQLLDLAGLWAAISSYALEFGRTHGIQVRIELPDHLERLPEAVEIGVFRVMEECLATIHEDFGGKEVSIRAKQEDGRVVITISDAGSGRKSAGPDWFARELTFVAMVERARQFRGVVEMNTTIDSGTTIRVYIPTGSRRGTSAVAKAS